MKPIILIILGVLFCLLSLVGGLIVGYNIKSANIAEADNIFNVDRMKVYEEINNYRVRKGLSPLKYNPKLCSYTQKRVEEIKSDWSHSGFYSTPMNLRCPECVYSGENLAKGQYKTEGVISGWLHSKEHEENIVSPHYTDTCIAVSYGVDKLDSNLNSTFIVQEFASY